MERGAPCANRQESRPHPLPSRRILTRPLPLALFSTHSRASGEYAQADGATNRGGAAGPLRALGGGSGSGGGSGGGPAESGRTAALAAPSAAALAPLPLSASASPSPPPTPPAPAPTPMGVVDSAAILAPVAGDMEAMNANLRAVVGDRHPMLVAAAEQIFGAGGKRLRPALVFLVARATADMMGLR